MANLQLTMATGNYDRVRALQDGSVRPEGIDLDFQSLFVGDIFRRMVKDREFHACELGLTFYLRTLDLEDPPFVAIPVFPMRMFRHAAIFVNAASGIESPKEMAGKKVGELFFYGHDAGVWAKGILNDDYGVRADCVKHYVGGVDRFVPKWDWLPFNPPPHADVEQLGPGKTLDGMLDSGEIDVLFSAIMPPSLFKHPKKVRRLFGDYEAVERDYFKRTGVFPVMHTFAIRRDVYRKNPWVARSLYKAFKEAKNQAYQQYEMGDAFMHNYFMVPWFSALRDENRQLMGEDLWPYGLEANRKTLDAFLRYHHEQGLSKRRYTPDELFVPETLAD